MTKRHLLFAPILFLLTLGLTLGCTKKNVPAQVSGSVTYKGAPVTGGNLAFHTDSGVYSAVIGTDGNYTATDLPVGDMVVTVDTESLNPNIKKETYTGQSSGGGASSKYGKSGTPPPPPKKAPTGAKAQEKSPAGEGSPQGDSGNYVKIPRTYADKTKSALKVNLKEGSQEINLELKD